MHATIEQLLACRDGKAGDAVQAHVSACEKCRIEVDRLSDLKAAMRAMPEIEPPAIAWAGIASAAQRQEASSVQRIAWAIAASVLIMALLVGSLTGPDSVPDVEIAEAGSVPGSSAAGPDVDSLIVRSQQLESLLQQLPRRPAVVRAGTDSTITSLTNSIAMVDYTLSATATGLTDQQSRQLWQQRVGLMDSLVKVRYAEASQTKL